MEALQLFSYVGAGNVSNEGNLPNFSAIEARATISTTTTAAASIARLGALDLHVTCAAAIIASTISSTTTAGWIGTLNLVMTTRVNSLVCDYGWRSQLTLDHRS